MLFKLACILLARSDRVQARRFTSSLELVEASSGGLCGCAQAVCPRLWVELASGQICQAGHQRLLPRRMCFTAVLSETLSLFYSSFFFFMFNLNDLNDLKDLKDLKEHL